jgi:hypothetical protein
MKHSKRRLAIIASTTAAVLLGGGIAAAYWTSTGNGGGSATTGTSSAVTFGSVSSPTGLVPGGTPSSVSFSVLNGGTAPVTITNIVLSVDPTFTSKSDASKPACTATDFTVSSAAPFGVNIPGGGSAPSNAWGSFTVALNNDLANNQDNCKGVTVPLLLSAS